MRKLWFITNPGSGSTNAAKCAALEAVFGERGLELAGRTDFPEQPVPDAVALDAAGVDTVVLFAGDGTINAALRALAAWGGAFLILPGGTMNLLAKALHDTLDPEAIIHAAHGAGARRVALPFIAAGEHRAFVGLILGPAAAWARAREAVRKGRIARLARAIRAAWSATFHRRGIRVRGAPGLARRYQAVFVFPGAGGMDVAAVDARDWGTIAQLGWEWLTGDWIAARAVTQVHARELRVRGNRRALALFDGEPVTLDPATRIRSAMSGKSFLATRAADPASAP
ncbi:diacylglycerol/lipid kinase family protein [Sphingomonas canadensis]|uniref:Diacylglycerol/lipid kinase family protein n=1 Tax=Sphingomonas canadensis TaxID=1219257 RepID=A0ABW3H7Z3_9SPHN|nr:diacylglycerol kinase family protein [Sphingomonas canadensis]MCW3837053.1 diacylglycerol kinase family protein [Sphingomonas canadensis]